jgi:primosomal protein N' (replication factor Y)
MAELYAEILFPRKLNATKETLTYLIPEGNSADFQVGDLVEVPLKKSNLRGLIWEIHQVKPAFNTKPIIRKITDFFSLTKVQIDLIKYISSQHFCPLHKSLKLFFPATVFTSKKSKNIQFKSKIHQTIASPFQLTPGQEKALEQIAQSKQNVFLLHGVTGSGKTEIYRRLAVEQIAQGKQVLILIPEISLTPQTVKNFEHQFGKDLAVIHSRLTPKEKLEYLTNIARGHYQITIGSRSAIFSPFQNLGLIIIDEEHEDSYKQDQAPRYHAREIAIKLTELSTTPAPEPAHPGQAVAQPPQQPKIILGSATPSIESYFAAQQGQYQLIEMPDRLPQKDREQVMPKIHLVDLRDELKKKNYSIFSELLQKKIHETFQKGEQTILFLNRRGAASAVICRDCGHTEECPNCSVALTYHSRINIETSILPSQRLICHHCGRIYPIPKICSECKSHLIKYIGLGTQKIEEELVKILPQARILRADKDTTSQKGDFEKIYSDFRDGHGDVLIGTQMIGKGLHLPNVTLVGVILADTGLTIPDFRSAEKTFQLLTQVAGRSGREKPGEVIIQTYKPEHFAIQTTVQHDYLNFYTQELHHRRESLFPPFQKLIKLTIENIDQEKAYYFSHQLYKDLQKFQADNPQLISEINLFPALISKLKNKYRWQILLNGANPHLFMQKFYLQKPFKNDIKIDVDPLNTI